MPVTPTIGETVDFHQRRPAIDASGTISGVNGTHVDIASLQVTDVPHVSEVGDTSVADRFWSYQGDVGDPIGLG